MSKPLKATKLSATASEFVFSPKFGGAPVDTSPSGKPTNWQPSVGAPVFTPKATAPVFVPNFIRDPNAPPEEGEDGMTASEQLNNKVAGKAADQEPPTPPPQIDPAEAKAAAAKAAADQKAAAATAAAAQKEAEAKAAADAEVKAKADAKAAAAAEAKAAADKKTSEEKAAAAVAQEEAYKAKVAAAEAEREVAAKARKEEADKKKAEAAEKAAVEAKAKKEAAEKEAAKPPAEFDPFAGADEEPEVKAEEVAVEAEVEDPHKWDNEGQKGDDGRIHYSLDYLNHVRANHTEKPKDLPVLANAQMEIFRVWDPDETDEDKTDGGRLPGGPGDRERARGGGGGRDGERRGGGGYGKGGGGGGGGGGNSWSRGHNAPRNNGGKGGKGGRGRHEVDTAPALEDCKPIEVNEGTRWKAKVFVAGGRGKGDAAAPPNETDEEKEKRVMVKARLILNKLSIEKFEKLSDQFVQVGIDTPAILVRIINTVVEKAQDEPHFAAMYSDLCMKLSTTPLPGLESGEGGKAKLFKRALLTKCQKDFEGEPEAVKLARPKWAQMHSEGLMSDEDMNLKEIWAKKCGLGHIRFIGELYKKALLSDRIMHECVIRLFGDIDNPDEEGLECLCKLMGTVGKRMEATEDSTLLKRMKKYYSEVKRMTSAEVKNPLSTRTRFLLKDLLDLRANRYVPRRKEEKATSLKEVHAEAMREEARSGGGNHGKGKGGKGDRDGKGGKGGRKGGAADRSGILARLDSYKNNTSSGPAKPAVEVDADGWETVVTAKPVKRREEESRPRDRDRRSDRDRERRRDRDEGGGGSAGGAFAALMGGSSKSKDKDRDRRRDRDDRDRDRDRRRDKEGGRERDRERRRDKEGGEGRERNRDRRKSKEDGPRSPQSPDEEGEFSSLADMMAAQAAAEGGGGGGGGGGKTMDRDKLKQKTKSILSEYYEIQDMKEATLCIEELGVPGQHADMVGEACDLFLNSTSAAREQAMRNLPTLLAGCDAITGDQLVKGLTEVIGMIEDLRMDIPKAAVWMAVLVGRITAANAKKLPLSFLNTACEPLVEDDKAASFAADVLVEFAASHLKGMKGMAAAVADSGFNLAALCKSEDAMAELLTAKKLEM